MAKKILSFQEYSETIKADAKNEISEEENEECPCGTDEEGNCIECEETTELPAEEEEEEGDDDDSDEDDSDEDDSDDDDDDDEEESDEDDDEGEEVEEAPEAEAEAPEAAPAEPTSETMTVETMLTEGYNKVKEAACAYEKDEYQDHTLEMYMKENAALVATLAATAMEEGFGEVKETELTQEMYEAHCNEMKDAYAKKIDELKEMYGAGKE
jgi:hypothetical protein